MACRVNVWRGSGFGAEEMDFQKDARTSSRSEQDMGLSTLGMEKKGHRIEL